MVIRKVGDSAFRVYAVEVEDGVIRRSREVTSEPVGFVMADGAARMNFARHFMLGEDVA